MPSEKFFTLFFPVFSRPTNASSSSIPSKEGIPSTRYCSLIFSFAVASRYTDGVSTTAPILRRHRAIFLSALPTPYRANVPDVGSCRPQIRRISVVLPAPFFPTKP